MHYLEKIASQARNDSGVITSPFSIRGGIRAPIQTRSGWNKNRLPEYRADLRSVVCVAPPHAACCVSARGDAITRVLLRDQKNLLDFRGTIYGASRNT